MTLEVPSPAVVAHLLKLTKEIAAGILKTVLDANGMPTEPALGRDLTPVPVFESGFAATLLSVANIRATTVVHWVAVPHEYLQAYYKRYRYRGADSEPMRNDIVVLSSNYCWSRFYAAKELFHCFLDDDGYCATNSIEAVNSLIESLVTHGITLSECAPGTAIDEFAWYGAMLYLIPDAWLPAILQLRADLQEAFEEENADLYLAQLLRVPELILRHRLKVKP